MADKYDIAIVGGGPAGSTVGSLLKKYSPALRVGIFEREKFPRDHVGESHLPVISNVLDEMGVWGKVEAADFPIKVGATYRWGRTDDLWDLEFIPGGQFQVEPRPAKFVGQRKLTAFQVDRSVYDKVLLDHASSLGCDVREETTVRSVSKDGDRVTGLTLEDGSEITARYYVDASGHSGILRRAMGIDIECPTTLQNIAIWEYWRNAEWAVSIGVGGTRIQVLSLPYGWLWFIPIGPDRTSIGLVIPASYYKEQGRRPEEIYAEALRSDPIISRLIQNAQAEGNVQTTKDWSFVAERLTGENWFLVGESAGFADPILSAGMTLAHFGGKDVAYAILAMERKDYEPEWIREFYCTTHRAQIRQHIRFADFWYTGNGVFSDLKDYAQQIATDAGLTMTAEAAWRWLAQGGFVERSGGTDIGLYGLLFTKEILASFTGDVPHYEVAGKTHFVLNLDGAEKSWTAELAEGRLTRRRMYRRDGKILPMLNIVGWMAQQLKTEKSAVELTELAKLYVGQANLPPGVLQTFWTDYYKSLEALVADGWVLASTREGAEPLPPPSVDFTSVVHPNHDIINTLATNASNHVHA